MNSNYSTVSQRESCFGSPAHSARHSLASGDQVTLCLVQLPMPYQKRQILRAKMSATRMLQHRIFAWEGAGVGPDPTPQNRYPGAMNHSSSQWAYLHIEAVFYRGFISSPLKRWVNRDSARCSVVSEVIQQTKTSPGEHSLGVKTLYSLTLITSPSCSLLKQNRITLDQTSRTNTTMYPQGQWNNSLTLLKLDKMHVFIY